MRETLLFRFFVRQSFPSFQSLVLCFCLLFHRLAQLHLALGHPYSFLSRALGTGLSRLKFANDVPRNLLRLISFAFIPFRTMRKRLFRMIFMTVLYSCESFSTLRLGFGSLQLGRARSGFQARRICTKNPLRCQVRPLPKTVSCPFKAFRNVFSLLENPDFVPKSDFRRVCFERMQIILHLSHGHLVHTSNCRFINHMKVRGRNLLFVSNSFNPTKRKRHHDHQHDQKIQ